ncbi:MAG: hypothetical protein HY060_23975 [Proteobacteria bacterium]|nr:hypothetical protein [Pseudomonadota bacterium]
MTGLVRNTSTSRWRTALRAGALVAALAVVAGAPLAAQAHDRDHGWRGHEAWRAHEWREHHGYWGHPYYAPRYYAPTYGYYAPGYYAPGAALSFTIR